MYITLKIDYINLFITMAIFTHGMEKRLYELNFSHNNKFCNVLLKIVLINEVSVVIVISKFVRND